jgi:hypothetical protein
MKTAKITQVLGTIGGDTVKVTMYVDGEFFDYALADSDTGAKIAAEWVREDHAALVKEVARCTRYIAHLRAFNDPMLHLWEDSRAEARAAIMNLITA